MRYSFILLILCYLGCANPFQNEQTNDGLWVQVASAEKQCITPDYSSLEDALQQLIENNIPVINSKELAFPVCEACSCPTGIVYLAQIDKNHLSDAQNLGWQESDEGDDTLE